MIPEAEQSKVDAARGRPGIFAAACGDNDELAAVHFVSGGSGVAGEGESRFPKQLTSGFIVSAEFLVEVGCPDEQQPARGDDRPAVIFGASVLQAFRSEFRVFT